MPRRIARLFLLGTLFVILLLSAGMVAAILTAPAPVQAADQSQMSPDGFPVFGHDPCDRGIGDDKSGVDHGKGDDKCPPKATAVPPTPRPEPTKVPPAPTAAPTKAPPVNPTSAPTAAATAVSPTGVPTGDTKTGAPTVTATPDKCQAKLFGPVLTVTKAGGYDVTIVGASTNYTFTVKALAKDANLESGQPSDNCGLIQPFGPVVTVNDVPAQGLTYHVEVFASKSGYAFRVTEVH